VDTKKEEKSTMKEQISEIKENGLKNIEEAKDLRSFK